MVLCKVVMNSILVHLSTNSKHPSNPVHPSLKPCCNVIEYAVEVSLFKVDLSEIHRI